jgi:methyl-accepting chemotaxis protein
MIKRRSYFIDKKFQGKFILKFCLIVIVSSVIVGGLLLFLAQGSTTVAIENTKVTVKNTASFLLPLILTTLIIVTVFSAISVAVLAMFISHKIAGPLYRIKKDIERLHAGDLTASFRIRKGDQLQDLADSLNEMASAMQAKVKQLKDSSLNNEVAKIREIIDYFRI